MPSNLVEILRHTLLLISLWGGLWLTLTPVPALLRVRTVDMTHEQRRWPKALSASQLTLGEFIARETEGRLIRVEGPTWEAFSAAISAATTGQSSSPDWAARRGREIYSDTFFFRPDELPLAGVAGGLGDNRSFTYLALSRSGQTAYLGVTYTRPRDAIHGAPAALLYPQRRYGLVLLLLGWAVYALLPWRRVAEEEQIVHYSRVRAVILPDLLGYVLTGLFFALPLWVIPANSTHPGLFDFGDGWGYLTLVCWAMMEAGIALLAWGAWYAAYYLFILPDRLQLHTLFRTQDVHYSDIHSVEWGVESTPKALVALGCLVSLFAWRALAPTLLMAGREDGRLDILCHDGRRVRLWAEAVVGLDRLVRALQQAGVPLAVDVERFVGQGDGR